MSKRFSASVAAQLMSCPGSAHLELSIPGWVEPEDNDEAPARAKGTMLHEYFKLVGELSPPDMSKMVEALAYVANLRQTRRFKALVEHTFTADWLRTRPETTPDLVLYTADELHIIDYKSGTIPVSPIGNHQLMYYAACAAPLAPKAKEVTLHIVQPWAENGIGSWVMTTKELGQFMLDARDAEQKILNKDTTLSPSDHCTFCPANPHSRSDKGSPLCPKMMDLLYPAPFDEADILADL